MAENSIVALREAKGLTQAELARYAGINRQQLSRLEAGKRKLTPEWAAKLAPLLGVSTEQVMFPHLLKQKKGGTALEAQDFPKDSLPSLVQRAAAQLASARTAAEVLDARDQASVAYEAARVAGRLAKAKGAHDDLIAKAHRAQADALEIEAMAKRRLADEYDRAQDAGEVASRGKPKRSEVEALPTAAELGITAKAVHEARIIRDAERADPGIVRRTIDERLKRGEEPTKASLRETVYNVAGRSRGVDPESRGGRSFRRLLALVSACQDVLDDLEERDPSEIAGLLDDVERDQVRQARDLLTTMVETKKRRRK